MTAQPDPAEPGGHLSTFALWDEDTRLAHMIKHGHMLVQLRELGDAQLDQQHRESHPQGSGADGIIAEPDLEHDADRLVSMSAALREHLAAGRWAEVYAAADWIMDCASTLHSRSWAEHPEARPSRWLM